MVCFLVVFYTHNRCCSCIMLHGPLLSHLGPNVSKKFHLGTPWGVCFRLYQIQQSRHFKHGFYSIRAFLPQDTFYTFINESKRSCLKTISPHLKLVYRSEGLPAKCSRSLFPSTYMNKPITLDLTQELSRGKFKSNKTISFIRVYLSMFQMGHKCYGTCQFGTQYQNP